MSPASRPMAITAAPSTMSALRSAPVGSSAVALAGLRVVVLLAMLASFCPVGLLWVSGSG